MFTTSFNIFVDLNLNDLLLTTSGYIRRTRWRRMQSAANRLTFNAGGSQIASEQSTTLYTTIYHDARCSSFIGKQNAIVALDTSTLLNSMFGITCCWQSSIANSRAISTKQRWDVRIEIRQCVDIKTVNTWLSHVGSTNWTARWETRQSNNNHNRLIIISTRSQRSCNFGRQMTPLHDVFRYTWERPGKYCTVARLYSENM